MSWSNIALLESYFWFSQNIPSKPNLMRFSQKFNRKISQLYRNWAVEQIASIQHTTEWNKSNFPAHSWPSFSIYDNYSRVRSMLLHYVSCHPKQWLARNIIFNSKIFWCIIWLSKQIFQNVTDFVDFFLRLVNWLLCQRVWQDVIFIHYEMESMSKLMGFLAWRLYRGNSEWEMFYSWLEGYWKLFIGHFGSSELEKTGIIPSLTSHYNISPGQRLDQSFLIFKAALSPSPKTSLSLIPTPNLNLKNQTHKNSTRKI